MGVWIETRLFCSISRQVSVTPCMGVWIETCRKRKTEPLFQSHPVWVCGLKQSVGVVQLSRVSHTLYGCVDWNSSVSTETQESLVTPCMGVWIETPWYWLLGRPRCHTLYGCVDWNYGTYWKNNQSEGHTLYGCVDWNLQKTQNRSAFPVTPCMGVWIETIPECWNTSKAEVTPCMGVWIETVHGLSIDRLLTSHPVWVCGLKQIRWYARCVPWTVTPCMGVWIETFSWLGEATTRKSHPVWVCGLKPWRQILADCRECHTLYGCVDWNIQLTGRSNYSKVTPCMGVWIETGLKPQLRQYVESHPVWVCGLKHRAWQQLLGYKQSHPVWVCGLKQTYSYIIETCYSHTLYGCVDWNLRNGVKPLPSPCHTLYGCVDWN